MYKVIYDKKFETKLEKFDNSTKFIILKWIKKHLMNCEDPKSFGKGLKANLKAYWRYRIGSYRLLVEIKENELVIIAIDVEHRSKIYK